MAVVEMSGTTRFRVGQQVRAITEDRHNGHVGTVEATHMGEVSVVFPDGHAAWFQPTELERV
jgi:hypothetical protein